MRYQIAHSLEQLYKQLNNKHTIKTMQQNHEKNIINQTKGKLTTHIATISRADKGNSIVILYQNDYNTKVTGFLDSNNFTIENKDPTSKFQKDIRDGIN
jgi:hypothetical protein